MSKSKVVLPALETWSDVDVALGALAETTAARAAVESALNLQLADVRAGHAARLDQLATAEKVLTAQIFKFAVKHRAEFAPAKSMMRPNGVLSFRTSPPSTALLSRKWTWKSVIESVCLKLSRYVHRAPELDKKAILSDFAEKKVTAEQLAECGIKIEQAETFGIELKQEKAHE